MSGVTAKTMNPCNAKIAKLRLPSATNTVLDFGIKDKNVSTTSIAMIINPIRIRIPAPSSTFKRSNEKLP